jgi:serine/threonine protein kinase
MNRHDLTQQDWAYPVQEIAIDNSDDGILGKGAFGIVRKARWCGSEVAVKQLHAQDVQQDGEVALLKDDDIDALIREMSICSRLRHPNLVLFLGVTYDPATSMPQSIVTEILPYSVYDLLENQHIRFDSHEVSEMACDIANALNYLHERKPAVVHRDISARNVLVDHRGRAKLSDLGQAKVCHDTPSPLITPLFSQT